MQIISAILIALVALEHVYILVMEMFLWTTPRVRRVFGTTKELAEQTKVLAANQGLYNGFLAAGLIYGLVAGNFAFNLFFLLCVIVAAVYGGLSTGKPRIMIVQGAPAALALLVLLILG